MSVSAPFVWRCLSGSTMAPFPHPSIVVSTCAGGRLEMECADHQQSSDERLARADSGPSHRDGPTVSRNNDTFC